MSILLILLLSFIHLKAQSTEKDSIFFRGLYVYDGFSEELLENIRVSVLEADSITVLNDSLNGGFEMSEINGQLKRDYTPLWGFAPAGTFTFCASRLPATPRNSAASKCLKNI